MLLLASGLLIFALYQLVFDSYLGGLASSILFYLYAPLYFWASNLHSETLFIFMFYAFAVAICVAVRLKNTAFYALAGVLLGLATITRTITLPIIILGSMAWCAFFVITHFGSSGKLFIPQILVKQGQDLALRKNISVSVVCIWIVIGCVTLRNYRVLNEFVLVNTAGGMNFYFGTIDNLSQKWIYESDNTVTPLRIEFGEVVADRELFKLAFQRILADPLAYVMLKIRTLYHYILPTLDSAQTKVNGFIVFNPAIQFAIQLLFFIGTFLILIRRKVSHLILLFGFFGLAISSATAFFTERFVIVLIPLYFIISVHGLVEATSLVRWIPKTASRSIAG